MTRTAPPRIVAKKEQSMPSIDALETQLVADLTPT